MVGNSKVLTVSYGTFSCTLEGFDDSFDTMKAIAEYFRDLAAEDRYSGAEPPQPDADVLARIAERELARGVHARAEGNAVLLKPSAPAEPKPAPAPTTTPVAEEAVTEPVVEETAEPAAETAPEVEEVAVSNDAAELEAEEATAEVESDEAEEALVQEEAEAEVSADVVAEETAPEAEIEAPVEDVEAADEPVSDEVVAGNEAIGIAESTEAEFLEAAEEKAPLEEASFEATEDAPVDEASFHEAEEAPVEVAEAIEEATEDAESEAAEGEFEAEEEAVAKAEHIALDQADAESPKAESADFSTEEDVAEDADEDAKANAARAAVGAFFQNDEVDASADVAETEVVEAVEETEEAERQDNSAATGLAAKLRRIQAVVGAARLTFKGPKDEAYTEDEHAEDIPAPSTMLSQADETSDEGQDTAEELNADVELPRVLKMKREEFEAALNNAVSEQDAEEVEVEADAMDAAGVVANEDEVAADEAAELLAEDEDADQDDEMPSIFREADAAETEEAPTETSLSAEDEADLMAELAAAEAEAHEEVAGAEASEDAADAVEADASGETAASFGDQEATMSRLMDEAEAKLDEPENRTRRDAYSHLKAAVAAKQAARSMGEDDASSDEKRENDYREDLAQVVRPRRAAKPLPGRRTSRPAPAPLKLVASQRIDTPDAEAAPAKPSAPVRPRRVAADEVQQAPNSAFAGFAESAGAEGLPDILEAAAAFVTHVEGKTVFSRPQMMRIVQQAMPAASFSSEDGLRAFGTLLRQGRINKIRGGQFEVTQSTRYQPEAREMRAAG